MALSAAAAAAAANGGGGGGGDVGTAQQAKNHLWPDKDPLLVSRREQLKELLTPHLEREEQKNVCSITFHASGSETNDAICTENVAFYTLRHDLVRLVFCLPPASSDICWRASPGNA